MYMNINIYAYIYIHTYINTYIHTYICICIYMRTDALAAFCTVCVCVHVSQAD
jgi:hypothetical protein